MKTHRRWSKLRAKAGSASGWSRDALADLQREIDRDKDSARWLRMSRALSRVREAIAESDIISAAASELADDRREGFRAARSKRWQERRQLTLELGDANKGSHA